MKGLVQVLTRLLHHTKAKRMTNATDFAAFVGYFEALQRAHSNSLDWYSRLAFAKAVASDWLFDCMAKWLLALTNCS